MFSTSDHLSGEDLISSMETMLFLACSILTSIGAATLSMFDALDVCMLPSDIDERYLH